MTKTKQNCPKFSKYNYLILSHKIIPTVKEECNVFREHRLASDFDVQHGQVLNELLRVLS